MNMRESLIEGIVKKVENLDKNFSKVTIQKGTSEEVVVPVYMKVEQQYVGNYTVIVSQKIGFFKKRFVQIISTFGLTDKMEGPYKEIKKINRNYL
jgi:hypothetical protein